MAVGLIEDDVVAGSCSRIVSRVLIEPVAGTGLIKAGIFPNMIFTVRIGYTFNCFLCFAGDLG